MARTVLTPGGIVASSGGQATAGSDLLNAYPVQFPTGARLSYRIWTVDPVPTTDELREKIRGFLWQTRLRRPVRGTYVGDRLDRYAYAVADWGVQEPAEYVGEGERRYTVRPTDDVRTVPLDEIGRATEGETELAAAMLQAALTLHLRGDDGLVRGHRADAFFLPTPDSPYVANAHRDPVTNGRRPQPSQADIFRGFTFRVAPVDGVGLCVVLDVQTSYVGRETLAAYLARGQRPRDIESGWGGTRWVHDYGRMKQSVYLVRVGEETIGEVRLRDNRTTYEYLCAVHPEVRALITPADRAATIMYRAGDLRNEAKHYPASTRLLKPKFTTESPEVRALGDTPAFPPAERFARIEAVRAHFAGARFAGVPVALGPAYRAARTTLPLARLLFGPADSPTLLDPPAVGSRSDHEEWEARRRWAQSKLPALQRLGPYRSAPFVNPHLVYPASLDDGRLLDDFLEQTKRFCEEYGKVPFDPQLSSYRDDAHPRDIIGKVTGIAANQGAGFVLLALPTSPAAADTVYAGVKTLLPVASKCFSTAKLRSQAREPQRLATYVARNALGMLVENGTRPWVLADPLAYEMHFGFDVVRTRHGGLMGAAVVTDPSGGDIAFYNEAIDAPERIPAKIIGSFVLDRLNAFFAAHGRAPRRILFQRDGRLLDTELRGIRRALEKFAAAHGVAAPEWAAIAIEKTMSVPLRFFRQTGGAGIGGSTALANGRAGGISLARAFSGRYFLQTSRVGYLVTAGDPSLRQGTPRPLRIELIAASAATADLVEILGDLFALAQLNWNSPEIDIRLPLTLRFTDQKLERYALELDPAEDDEDDWDQEPDEEDGDGGTGEAGAGDDPGAQAAGMRTPEAAGAAAR